MTAPADKAVAPRALHDRAGGRLRIALIGLLLVLAGSVPASGQAPGPTDPAAEALRLNEEGVRLYRAGDLGGAAEALRRALALTEQALGPAHSALATPLNNLALVLKAAGDYAAARPLYERALALDEAAHGPDHPEVAAGLNNLAGLLRVTGDLAGARAGYERALRINERALGPAHPDLGSSLNNLALVLKEAGEHARARVLYERALRIKEQALGPGHPDVAAALNNLAALLEATADFDKARALHERALRIKEQALGPGHLDVALSLNNLAALLMAVGDHAGARPLIERALRIQEATLGPAHPRLAASLGNLAGLMRVAGDVAAARALHERAVRILEDAFGADHPHAAVALGNLASLLEAMGQVTEARGLYERALAIKERWLGPDHLDVATALNNLAVLLRGAGDPATARPLIERALAISERRLGPEHPDVALGLNNLAALLHASRDLGAARPLYTRALAIRERVFGPDHPDVATSLANLGALEQATGDLTLARLLYEGAVSIWERALGPSHPDVAAGLRTLAALREATGDLHAARPLWERARRIELVASRTTLELGDEAQRGLGAASRHGLRAYIALLARLAAPPAPDTSASSDAFVTVEQARAGSVQAALARAAARAAAGDPATAALARRAQDLRRRRAALWTQLAAERAQPPSPGSGARLAALRQATAETETALADATARLFAAFPRYAELAAPEPIDLAGAARLLHPGEALLSLHPIEGRVLAWLVRPERSPVYRDIVVRRPELAALVSRVRSSLDQSANPDLPAGRLLPFDVEGAHALYTTLLAPLAGELAGVRHLFIVPDEVLLPLPFAALLSRAEGEPHQTLAELHARGLSPTPAQLADYAKLPWLAKDLALTVLPSATSLRALRGIAPPPARGAEPLIAFGDPVLGGRGRQRGGSMLAARGARIALGDLRALARLPGTRDELMAIARALGADPGQALSLGDRATETEVRVLNRSSRLGRARVVAFATHGLIGGELGGLSEPALVLTPPAVATEEDDGLLSLTDILELQLTHAEWVVLSACNTAAADGSGEGLAGLVRAFFFAGAPALLVSHWSVEDRATAALMTEVFRRHAADPSLPRAEALRQGMLALLARARGATAYFAHPFAWAAFFVAGDGGPAR